MAKNILVVCAGNICRSPMAESLFRHRLSVHGGEVESAGLAALVGHPADAHAESVLQDHGLTADRHRARQVDADMVDSADLVLAMEKSQILALHSVAPGAFGKTFLLGRWLGAVDIPDPFRRKREDFVHVYRMIELAVDSWCRNGIDGDVPPGPGAAAETEYGQERRQFR